MGLALAAAFLLAASGTPMRAVGPGAYEAFIKESPGPGAPARTVLVVVARFEADERPVSDRDFRAFVAARPEWAPGRVPRTFADAGYLSHWRGKSGAADGAVTNVSWFAASAYCEAQGKRLPTIHEWEFMARPEAFGTDWAAVQEKILEWYASPGHQPLSPERRGVSPCTKDGVCDLHGSIWEWVEDFGSIIATDEGRGGDRPDEGLFCGAGALGATDPGNYLAFMRYAFRSSLKGDYTLGHLGFRCVK